MVVITIIGIFLTTLISKYLNSMSSCGVDYIELGFRSFESKLLKVLVHIPKMNF